MKFAGKEHPWVEVSTSERDGAAVVLFECIACDSYEVALDLRSESELRGKSCMFASMHKNCATLLMVGPGEEEEEEDDGPFFARR